MELKQREEDMGYGWRVWPFVLILGLFSGCTVTGPIRGQVLDAQTGQPLAGAVALAVWTTTEGFPGQYSTKLVGVQEAETDVQGRFTLQRPASGIHAGQESVTVYKFGYTAWNNREIFPTYQRRESAQVLAEIRLDRFPLGGDHRRHLDFISDVIWSTRKSETPTFDKAIDAERRIR